METGLKTKRRPITYGKSLRKAPLAFQFSSPASSPSKEPFKATPDEEAPAWSASDGSVFGSKSPQTPPPKMITLNAMLSSDGKRQKLQYEKSPEAIFDVPSSDEEHRQHRTGTFGAYNKRRKVTSPRKSWGTESAWGHSRLQKSPDAQAQHSRLSATTHASKKERALVVPQEEPDESTDMLLASPTIFSARQASGKTSKQIPRTKHHQTQREISTTAKSSHSDSRPNPKPEKLQGQGPVVETGKTKPEKMKSPQKYMSQNSEKRAIQAVRNDAICTPSTLEHAFPAREQTPDAYDPEPASLRYSFSPGTIGLKALQISSSEKRVFKQASLPSNQRSRSQKPSYRPKLKDRLHASHLRPEQIPSDGESSISADEVDVETSNESDGEEEDTPQTRSASSSQANDLFRSRTEVNILGLGDTAYGAPKVTYARQRSHLTEDDVASGPGSFAHSQESFEASQNSRGSQASKDFSLTSSALHESVDELDNGTLKTIHELRESGGNVRQMGEAETILEDIDSKNSTSLSLRRSGLLDLATKLQASSFCQKFVENGLGDRLFAQTDTNSDQISTQLLMCSLMPVLAITSKQSSTPSIPNLKTFRFLLLQLGSRDELEDLVKSRRGNISRAFQQDFREFCSSFRQSSPWYYGCPLQLSSRVITLQCMEHLLRCFQHTPLEITKDDLDQISSLLQASDGIDTTASSRDSLIDHLAISCLELATLASLGSIRPQEPPWTRFSVDKLVDFLSSMDRRHGERSGATKTSTLRLCLNLTNHNQALCGLMSKAQVIQAALATTESNFRAISQTESIDEVDLLLDHLVLSLGLMINITEGSVTGLELFMEAGRNSQMPLHTLLELYLSRWQTSSEILHEQDIKSNVPLGYLAVLLAYLSTNEEANKLIRSRLPNHSLAPVLSTVGEFLRLHRQIEEASTRDGPNEVKISFVQRVQRVLDGLHSQERARW